MNYGAVLRSAYYLGVDRVLTSLDHVTSPLSPMTSKASSGVMEVFPPFWVGGMRTADFLERMTSVEGWEVVGSGVAGDDTPADLADL